MTPRSKNSQQEKTWSEFAEEMVASRLASKDAAKNIYKAQDNLKAAASFIALAAQAFGNVNQDTMVKALKNSIENLAKEERYLETISNIFGIE